MKTSKKNNSPAHDPGSITLEQVVVNTLTELGFCYKAYEKEGDFESYQSNFFELMLDASFGPQAILNELSESTRDKTDLVFETKMKLITAIRISLWFCLGARLSHEGGETGEAWHFISQSNKWLGIAYGMEFGAQVFHNKLNVMALSGARGRDERFQPLRNFVREEVKKRNYKSKRNAALTLKPDVLKLAKELDIGISEQQAEKTISAWLNGLTFAGKQGTLAGKHSR